MLAATKEEKVRMIGDGALLIEIIYWAMMEADRIRCTKGIGRRTFLAFFTRQLQRRTP
jgi:hypothetical protein